MVVIRRLGRWLLVASGAFLGVVVLYRFVPPPVTPVMLRNAPAYGIHKRWTPLDRIAPVLVRSVIAAEDASFFTHAGVDWEAIRRARDYNVRHGGAPRRGGSTISMQCARNVFLWQGKSYVRKAIEVGIATLLELVWGKRRILEVYLNVIEWGPGVYGAEAASQRYFGVPASALDAHEAALLAAALPSPRRYVPSRPGRWLSAHAAVIERRAARIALPAPAP